MNRISACNRGSPLTRVFFAIIYSCPPNVFSRYSSHRSSIDRSKTPPRPTSFKELAARHERAEKNLETEEHLPKEKLWKKEKKIEERREIRLADFVRKVIESKVIMIASPNRRLFHGPTLGLVLFASLIPLNLIAVSVG